jgi:hypothetical protein
MEVCNQNYKTEISGLKPGMFLQAYAMDMQVGHKNIL